MKKIDEQIKQIQAKTETAQSFLTDLSFAAYQEDHLTQGKILDNRKKLCDKNKSAVSWDISDTQN